MRGLENNDPPIFKGDTYLPMVEKWMQNIEKIFEYVMIPNEDKVICVTYMLKKISVIGWVLGTVEFINLKQEDQLVMYYIKKFKNFSLFAPHIS